MKGIEKRNIENGITWKWAKSYPGNVYCSHPSIVEAENNKRIQCDKIFYEKNIPKYPSSPD